MIFGMSILSQSTKTKQDYAIWILIASLFILKQKIFMKILLAMLKNGLTQLTIIKKLKPLPIGINKKVIGKFKDELGGMIMIEFVGLRAKTYSYLINGYNDEDYEKNKIINNKAKDTKKCIIKRKLMFGNYKESLFDNKNILKSQQRFRSDHY